MKKMEVRKQMLSYIVAYPDWHDKIEDLLATVPSDTALELISDNPFISKPYFKILHAINTLFCGFGIISNNAHRCHDFDDCFSSCTVKNTGLSGCEVKEGFRFNSTTTETSNPLRLAKLIMWAVPRLLPSQNAISASEALAISALRIMPAALPKALHLAG